MIEDLLDRLAQRAPGLTLTRDPDELALFGRDWTKVYTPAPSLVAFPRTREEVQTLLATCNELGVAVVPSGGRTGLAAGAVAAKGEVVLSLDKMRSMGDVDVLGGTVRVEAGAVTAAVHEHCEKHGMTWPVDFASKGSSSIGGNIATNAGGVKVIRYGLTRQWVLGLEVVLADGTFLELNGALEKNNTGIDLRQLFIGSEGILGVITAATLKLAPVPKKLDVFLFGVRDLAAVLALFREARRGPFTISAFEFFTQGCLERVRRHRSVRPPFDEATSHYVLLEVEHGEGESLEGWLSSLFERELVLAGTMAQHDREARQLWEMREGISESLSATGLPHKNDIALPIARLEAFCAELEAVFAANYPGFEVLTFGHIGDGNLHVNVMKPEHMDKAEFLAHAKKSDVHMFELVRKHKGSISAEHGVGLLKRDFLHFSRAPEELVLLRALKGSLDPKNTLNPGKILA